MQFTQAVPDFEGPQDIFVFDVTDDISDVVLLRHHVIFTRDPEHIQATEFFEFDNRTDPPRAIRSSALPMRLQLDHDTHGAACQGRPCGLGKIRIVLFDFTRILRD